MKIMLWYYIGSVLFLMHLHYFTNKQITFFTFLAYVCWPIVYSYGLVMSIIDPLRNNTPDRMPRLLVILGVITLIVGLFLA